MSISVHGDTRSAKRRPRGRYVAVGAAILTTAALAIAPAATAAQKVTIYNNIPAPLPGNVPSIGFEATATSEFGGQVAFDEGSRSRPRIGVVFSSWACQQGSASTGDCKTVRGATFTHDITVNIYRVKADNEPGALFRSVTQETAFPYRPSANHRQCSGADAGKWYNAADGSCNNGKAVTRYFALLGNLPDKVIVSVAFNTSDYGVMPIGHDASCYGTDSGCPYDSLNVGTSAMDPTQGTQPLPDDAYLNSSYGPNYCDGGEGGTDSFRLDSGCWTGYQPAFSIQAS